MVGPSNSTNKFGGSSYCVGTPANGLGNGVNFTSIQAAYDQAVLDGHGPLNPTTIFIRPGTYTEDLTITDGGIPFVGIHDATLGGFVQPVVLNGSVTCTITGPNAFAFSNMAINNSLGLVPAMTITGAAIACRVALSNCILTGPAGTYALEVNNPSGTFGTFGATNCLINGDLAGAYINSRTILNLLNSSVTGNTDGVLLDSTGRVTSSYSFITGASGAGVFYTTAANQANVTYSSISASLAAFDSTVGGVTTIRESIVNSSDASGFWVVGTGNLTYCDIVNQGPSIGIDPGLAIITVDDWKPYAQSGAGPAPSLGTVRGTACFDSAAFNVTDGFVEISGSTTGAITQLNGDTGSATPIVGIVEIDGGPGVTTNGVGNVMTISAVNWEDIAIAGLLNVDTGYIDLGPNTYTLPAAPTQGEQVRMFSANSPTVLQANVGQSIQIGNIISSVAGTATGSDTGDCIVLIWSDTLSRWFAESLIGNWVLA